MKHKDIKKILNVGPGNTGGVHLPGGNAAIFSTLKTAKPSTEDIFDRLLKLKVDPKLIERARSLQILSGVLEDSTIVLEKIQSYEQLLQDTALKYSESQKWKKLRDPIPGNGPCMFFVTIKLILNQLKLSFMYNRIAEIDPASGSDKINKFIEEDSFFDEKGKIRFVELLIKNTKDLEGARKQDVLASDYLKSRPIEEIIEKQSKVMVKTTKISDRYYELVDEPEIEYEWVQNRGVFITNIFKIIAPSGIISNLIEKEGTLKEFGWNEDFIKGMFVEYPFADKKFKYILTTKKYIKDQKEILFKYYGDLFLSYGNAELLEKVRKLNEKPSYTFSDPEISNIYKSIRMFYFLSSPETVLEIFSEFIKEDVEQQMRMSDQQRKPKDTKESTEIEVPILKSQTITTEDGNDIEISTDQQWFIDELLNYKSLSEVEKKLITKYLKRCLRNTKGVDITQLVDNFGLGMSSQEILIYKKLAKENGFGVYEKSTNTESKHSVEPLKEENEEKLHRENVNQDTILEIIHQFHEDATTFTAHRCMELFNLMGETIDNPKKFIKSYNNYLETPEGKDLKSELIYQVEHRWLNGHMIWIPKNGGLSTIKLSGAMRLVKDRFSIKWIMDHKEYDYRCFKKRIFDR